VRERRLEQVCRVLGDERRVGRCGRVERDLDVALLEYYLALLQDMFFVLTDADHKSGFKSTALVLARLFKPST
jgi:hypothetical protein